MLRFAAFFVIAGLIPMNIRADPIGEMCIVGGLRYFVGQSFSSSEGCFENSCLTGGKFGTTGCNPKTLPPDSPCRVVENPGQYPDCCPQFICPGEVGF